MKIAIFDYVVTPSNPTGGCHWRLLQALSSEHQFTVFAPQFDNPCPERINWVQMSPLIMRRPAALMYCLYQLMAPLYYLRQKLIGKKYDVIQVVTPMAMRGDVTYSQFCNRAFLRNHWTQCRPSGVRGALRWLDHKIQALLEPFALSRVGHVIAPCLGLVKELVGEYPQCDGKVRVIHNSVDLTKMQVPAGFDRMAVRQELGFSADDTVLVFTALGHFERKGLPLLLDAMAQLRNPRLKLLVVGGEADLVSHYRELSKVLDIAGNLIFLGRQNDVRRYLWAGDAFAFPSYYEAFSLSMLEAAGAGLPLIVAMINGIEELIRDGENGFIIEHNAASVAAALNRFLALSPQARTTMGRTIQADVERFAAEHFVDAWRSFYEELSTAGAQ